MAINGFSSMTITAVDRLDTTSTDIHSASEAQAPETVSAVSD